MIYTSPLIINYLRCSLRQLVCRVVILVWMIDMLLAMQDLYKRERESIGFFNLYIFQMCMYSQSLRPDGQASKTGSYSLLIIIVRQWGLGLA